MNLVIAGRSNRCKHCCGFSLLLPRSAHNFAIKSPVLKGSAHACGSTVFTAIELASFRACAIKGEATFDPRSTRTKTRIDGG